MKFKGEICLFNKQTKNLLQLLKLGQNIIIHSANSTIQMNLIIYIYIQFNCCEQRFNYSHDLTSQYCCIAFSWFSAVFANLSLVNSHTCEAFPGPRIFSKCTNRSSHIFMGTIAITKATIRPYSLIYRQTNSLRPKEAPNPRLMKEYTVSKA